MAGVFYIFGVLETMRPAMIQTAEPSKTSSDKAKSTRFYDAESHSTGTEITLTPETCKHGVPEADEDMDNLVIAAMIIQRSVSNLGSVVVGCKPRHMLEKMGISHPHEMWLTLHRWATSGGSTEQDKERCARNKKTGPEPSLLSCVLYAMKHKC